MQTLYRDGLVFDGAGKMLLGDGVLVEDRHIRRVAPLAEFEDFAGRVVDTAGGTLMPGIIDAHLHLLLTGGPDQLGPLSTLPPIALAFGALKNAQDALMGGV